jgi:hypothetical protein
VVGTFILVSLLTLLRGEVFGSHFVFGPSSMTRDPPSLVGTMEALEIVLISLVRLHSSS